MNLTVLEPCGGADEAIELRVGQRPIRAVSERRFDEREEVELWGLDHGEDCLSWGYVPSFQAYQKRKVMPFIRDCNNGLDALALSRSP